MNRFFFPLLIGFIWLIWGASTAFADTLPTDHSLLYEYWPSQTGAEIASLLTVSSMNSNSYNPLALFVSTSTIRIHTVCLAVDSYNSIEPALKLGIYRVSENFYGEKKVSDLIEYSDPRQFDGTYIDWYYNGDITCFNFSNPITLHGGAQYAIGIDGRNNVSPANDDMVWYNFSRKGDSMLIAASAAIFPGAIYISTDGDRPYIRIYGETVSVLEPVVIIPGILGSWEKNGEWILDPLAHTYDNLVDTLLANGYIKNQNLFTFPYDWEQSNIATAHQLSQKISQIKATCNCDQVDIVAHSMGGLIASQYIESTDYSNDVDQLIMLGTPLFGAPRAYKIWESGEISFADEQLDFLINWFFGREAAKNGYENIFEYIHNKPIQSIQELLPIQSYLQLGSKPLVYPVGYPRNFFLENLIGTSSFPSYTYQAKVLDKVRVTAVNGNLGLDSTQVGYVVKNSTQLPKWPDGEIVSNLFSDGDGTVPAYTFPLITPSKILSETSHTQLASAGAGYVFAKLTGFQPSTVVEKTYGLLDRDYSLLLQKIAPSKLEFKDFVETFLRPYLQIVSPGSTFLFITLYSPVDMQVTAPDGKKMGKDLVSGANLDEIPNAVYSGPIDEHEYLLIVDPIPGQYKVETIGTGNGAYTVAAGRMDASTSSISLLSGTTTLNQIISNSLFYSSTSTTIVLNPPLSPVATSTPTTTTLTPDTCLKDMTKAYQDKWIGKKVVYEKLVFDCKALKELFKARDAAKNKLALNLVYAAIKLTLADMELLAKNKGNIKDAVLLITKYVSWFREHELGSK